MRAKRDKTDLVVVSYFNPSDFIGGAERAAWAEAELLSGKQSVVFLSTSLPIGEAPFRQVRVGGWTRSLYQPKGKGRNPVKLAVFHLLSLFNPFVFLESLVLFRRLRPAVVNTHNLLALSPAVWLSARLTGARILHTHQDLWLLCEYATMTDGEGRPCNESRPVCGICRALRPAKKLQIRAVSAEIFPSNWLRNKLGREGALVPNFSTSRPQDAAHLEPDGPAIVAFVGALTAHKVGALLAAFELASASGTPPMQLVIAGTGPLEAKVSAAAAANPRISYLGTIDDDGRDRLLAETSVLLIPSTWPETSPLVFFEALAAGVPVIGSDIGGMTELERFGNLVLVPPGEPEELAAALVALLTDRARLEGLRAEARRHHDFASPERFVADVNRVLAELRGAADVPAGDSVWERSEGASSARDQAR